MGRLNGESSLNHVNTIPIAEQTASNREQKTKRYNKVNPTESKRGRILLVSPRQQRLNALVGKGWMRKRMLVGNEPDRGSKFASDRKE